MEHLTVKFEPEVFEKLVHGGAAQASDVTIAVKEGALSSGRPGVVIAFSAEVDGKIVQVQAVTTARLLVTAGQMILAKYPELMK